MADTFEFLSLSDTEELEKPGDSTMALVLDEGVVKRVPASQFGGGSYIVNVTTADGATWTADKSYADIVAAIEGGAFPVAAVDMSIAMGDEFKMYAPLAGYGRIDEDTLGIAFAPPVGMGMGGVVITSADMVIVLNEE